MKTMIRSLTVAGTALVLSTWGASALDWSNVYVQGDVGGAFQSDWSVKVDGMEMGIGFNPGIRSDLAIGYNLNEEWAVELESGFIWNSVDTLAGEPLDGSGISVDLYQVPILANLKYNFKPMGRFAPYAGVGVGGIVDVLDVDAFEFNESSSGIAFAYQFQLGVKYNLSDRAAVDLGYKLLGSADHSLSIEGENLTADEAFVHMIGASFTWRF